MAYLAKTPRVTKDAISFSVIQLQYSGLIWGDPVAIA